MGFELFIAKRISSAQKGSSQFSKPIITIATIAVALGVAVMIVSLAVVNGFKKEIISKVVGFGSHIQVTSYENNNSLELNPISKDLPFYNRIKSIKDVRNIQVFATKAGIIKTNDEIYGISIKGIDKDYDWGFFKDKLTEGSIIHFSDTTASEDFIISKYVCNKLKLKLGDKVKMYFIINNELRARVFKIAGIYQSGFEELDKSFALADIKHVQKLNSWRNEQIGGYEILLNDFEKLNEVNKTVFQSLSYDLNTKTIRENKPEIFNWLDFLNVNISVILSLMTIVAAINMISSLLIIILEYTNMIGLLKSFGAKNGSIRKIFLYNSSILLFKGLLYGNLIGIGICMIQKYTGLIKLDQATYYVSSVPISINWLHLILLNIGTIIICILLEIIPSAVISKLNPLKTIRYE